MLRVVVQHAVAMVPVVGPVLSIGTDLLDAVYSEVEGSRTLSPEEVVALLRAIDRSQVDETVDEVLLSAPARAAVSRLDQAQLLRLRRELTALPDELAQAVRHARNSDRLGLSKDQRERARRRSELESAVADQLRRGDYKAARKALGKRYLMGDTTPAVRQAEKYLFQRKERGAAVLLMVLVGMLGIVVMGLASFEKDVPDSAVLLVGLVEVGGGVLIGQITRHLSLWPRITLVFLFFLASLFVPLFIALHYPDRYTF